MREEDVFTAWNVQKALKPVVDVVNTRDEVKEEGLRGETASSFDSTLVSHVWLNAMSCCLVATAAHLESLQCLARVKDICRRAYKNCRKLKESEWAMKKYERLMKIVQTVVTAKGYDTLTNMGTQLASLDRACGNFFLFPSHYYKTFCSEWGAWLLNILFIHFLAATQPVPFQYQICCKSVWFQIFHKPPCKEVQRQKKNGASIGIWIERFAFPLK